MKLHKNTVLRRCVAMLLVVMMCVSLLNLTAFAEGVCRQHSFGTPQTDPKTGEPYVQCSSCGRICHQIDNDGHKFVTSTDLPTCEDAGCIKYTCPECDYYEEETIPALGHTYGDWAVVRAATVKEPGLEQRVCSRDSSHVETREIPQLTCEHKNTYEEGKNPSCTEAGYKKVVCKDCGQEISDTINALGHIFKFDKVLTEPTCTASGKEQYQCERCNATEEREIPAKGHVCPDQLSWDDTHHWSECKVCGYVIEKKAHDWQKVYEKPATCTEPGEVKWDCATLGCNASKVEILSATGHAWDQGTVVKPATENEAGIIIYTCQNDPSHTITKWLPMLENNTCDHKNGNKVDADLTIEPTCTEVGWEYHVCVDCGWLMDKKPIPALGHKWGPWKDTGDPLKHFRHCERENCDYEETGIHENWVTFTKDPTCTEDGYTEKKCADCGYSETTVIPATGHEWEDFVSEGEKGHQKECAKCGSHENGEHNYVESFTKEPTCTENGYKEEKCTDCGYAKMTEIPATGHEWGNFVSEGEKGHQRECAKCGSHENDDHRFNEGEQATEDGKNGIKFTCQDCGYSYFVPEDETVTVTWVNEDGTLLHQLENVKLEEIPAGDQYAALSGKQNPTKAEDADYTYAFSGWNREVDTEGNVTYTAQYTPTRKPVSPPISIIIPPTQPTNPDEDIDDPDVPLGTPRPEEPTPTPDPGEDIGDPDVPQGTPRPEEPTPTPDPGEDIGDPDVPLGTPDPGDEPIEDPDVPLGTPKPEQTPAPKPGADEEDIPDGNVPLANTPKTGDDASVWLLLTAISAAGLVFLGTSEWKKRKKI